MRSSFQATDGNHDAVGKFLNDVVKLGTRLRDLGVPECRLNMKEPEVGILSRKIRKFDGNLGNKLGDGQNRKFIHHVYSRELHKR